MFVWVVCWVHFGAVCWVLWARDRLQGNLRDREGLYRKQEQKQHTQKKRRSFLTGKCDRCICGCGMWSHPFLQVDNCWCIVCAQLHHPASSSSGLWAVNQWGQIFSHAQSHDSGDVMESRFSTQTCFYLGFTFTSWVLWSENMAPVWLVEFLENDFLASSETIGTALQKLKKRVESKMFLFVLFCFHKIDVFVV